MQTENRFTLLPKKPVMPGIFFIILIIWEIGIYSSFGDDLVYAKVWEESPLDVFLKYRYEAWSSRIVIEAVMMLLIAASPYVWHILNTAVILILIWITADLFGIGDKKQTQLIFFALIWLVPLDMINIVGWITTTVNYLWPLALGMVAMRPLKHWFGDKKCEKWEYIICPLCVLYAANQEQMAAILLGVYLLCGVSLIISKKRLPYFYMIQLLLIAASLYFIIQTPGNSVRYDYSVEQFFPEYGELGAISKLLMGFLTTANYYIAGGSNSDCYLFMGMTGVLFICFLTRKPHEAGNLGFKDKTFCGNRKEAWQKGFKFAVALCPSAAYWMCAHFFKFLLYTVIVSRARNLLWCLSENTDLPARSAAQSYLVVFQMIFYLAVVVCVALTIYFLHGRSCETMLELLVLGVGLASRVIMGFSPTVYASGNRTATFCSMALLIVMLRNLQLWMKKGQKPIWKMIMGIYVCGAVLCNIV